jgi:hypothetical protein
VAVDGSVGDVVGVPWLPATPDADGATVAVDAGDDAVADGIGVMVGVATGEAD